MRNLLHSTRNLPSWQVRCAIPLGLLLLTIVYFWRQLIEGRVLYWGDIGLYFTPMTEFLRHNLREGRLPLWNPWILCGTPYLGNPQTWPLYPVTALLPFLSAPYFLNLTIALHVWLAGIGTYLFARQGLSLRRSAALLSAITFMFGGQFVSKEQFPNMVQAMAWLPWVLLCLDRLLTRRRPSDALWLGVVLGLQLLAAHPQMTLLTLYLAFGWGIFVRKKPPAMLLLSICIAFGLAAGQLLPTLGLFRDAARQKLSFTIVNRFFLPTNELGNFVLPKVHGHPFFGDWSARGNFWESCCYLGWASCLLAIWGIISAFRRKGLSASRFWVIILILGVWMATGGIGGLYPLAYRFLPGFRSFHDPARCLFWGCFALSLLAGYGWQTLAARVPNRWAGGLILLLAFADLAHFGQAIYPLADPATLHPTSPNVDLVSADADIQAHQARILAPTPGVWLRFTNYKDFRQNQPDYQTLWADTLTPNLMMNYHLPDAYGYEPVALKNGQETTGHAAEAFYPAASREERAQATERAGALSVKYIALCRVKPPEGSLPGLSLLRSDRTLAPPSHRKSAPAFIYLLQNSRWLPRARLASSPTLAVPLTDTSHDQVILRPVTRGADSLILADTEAAGWSATVDGNAAPVQTTNGCLRSVHIANSGSHVVIFSYLPTLFRLGLYLSLLTMLGLLACAIQSLTRKYFQAGGFSESGGE